MGFPPIGSEVVAGVLGKRVNAAFTVVQVCRELPVADKQRVRQPEQLTDGKLGADGLVEAPEPARGAGA